jgi:hypothetical protein
MHLGDGAGQLDCRLEIHAQLGSAGWTACRILVEATKYQFIERRRKGCQAGRSRRWLIELGGDDLSHRGAVEGEAATIEAK